ncbi:MAG: hypothetical protein PVG83_05620 [Acidimicrobiia bacterium]|jgi:hypothetical protein
MSKSGSDTPGSEFVGPAAVQVLLSWARSWQLGLILAVLAIGFVAVSWRSVDFDQLFVLPPGAILGSAGAYAMALGSIALAVWQPGPPPPRTVIGSGLAAQILKYVPGSVWQGQRILGVAGWRALTRFTGVVFAAAGIGLAVSGGTIAVIAGVSVVAVTLTICIRFLSPGEAASVGLVSAVTVISIVLSGAFLGWGLGIDPMASGRDVVGAWGLGALAVPIPAGVGIREFYFSVTNDPDVGAQLAIGFRAVTLIVDVVVGSLGLWMSWRVKDES